MARIDSFFKFMKEQSASDLHLSTGNPPMLKTTSAAEGTFDSAGAAPSAAGSALTFATNRAKRHALIKMNFLNDFTVKNCFRRHEWRGGQTAGASERLNFAQS